MPAKEPIAAKAAPTKAAPTKAFPAWRGNYYLQLDIANFFNSIDRRLLFGLIRERIGRDLKRRATDPRHLDPTTADDILWLTRVLLTGNAAEGSVQRGTPAEFACVPPHKRLINAPAETGLPIGNLTSQFFANVYLNELDQFVKHTLKCRYYVRYVDDFVLLDPDPEVLARWRVQIAEFLERRLGLRLRDAGRLRPVSDGIDFLGYVVRPGYRLVRRRVVAHLREKLDRYGRQITGCARGAAPPAGAPQTWRLPPDPQPLFSMLASYLGHFRHASSHRLVASLWQRYPWLGCVVKLGADGRLLPTESARGVASMRGQWRYFKQRFPQACVVLQVGNRIEIYGDDARRVMQWCRMGGTSVARSGWARDEAGLSWPLARREGLLQALSRHGLAWVYADEQGWLKGGLKRRSLRRLHWPAKAVHCHTNSISKAE